MELTTGIFYDGDDCKEVMAIIRKFVMSFTMSNAATAALKEFQLQLGPGCIPVGLIQDVVTRWWSTYMADV